MAIQRKKKFLVIDILAAGSAALILAGVLAALAACYNPNAALDLEDDGSTSTVNSGDIWPGGDGSRRVDTPTAAPPAGPIPAGQAITLSCATPEASIYYTTDGSDPTASATRVLYSGDITLTLPGTIKAIAVKAGMLDSKVLEADYSLDSITSVTTNTFDSKVGDNTLTITLTGGAFAPETSLDLGYFVVSGGNSGVNAPHLSPRRRDPIVTRVSDTVLIITALPPVTNDGRAQKMTINPNALAAKASGATVVASHEIVVGTSAGSTAGHADGAGPAAYFRLPTGITTDGTDNYLYVADTGNHRIRKIEISSSTASVNTWLGSGTAGYDENKLYPKFNSPVGVTMPAAGGSLFIADTKNHRIRERKDDGTLGLLAGTGNGYMDGLGTGSAKFNNPAGLAVSGDYLYVADADNNRIRHIKLGVITNVGTLAGDAEGFADDTDRAARFKQPKGIAADSSGNLYVADTGNNRIRKIVVTFTGGSLQTINAAVSTFAGSGNAGAADGPALTAEFNQPEGLVVDKTGSILYVADTGNNRIRRIDMATGEVTTIAGGAAGFADGIGATAQFDKPTDIAVASYNLYVTDTNNNRIRKIWL